MHFPALIHDVLVSQFSSQRTIIFIGLWSPIHTVTTHVYPTATFYMLLEIHWLKCNKYWKYCQHDLLRHKVGEKKIFIIFHKYICLQMYIFTGSLNKIALRNVPWGPQGHKSTEFNQQCVFFNSLSLVLESACDQKRSKESFSFMIKFVFPIRKYRQSFLCANFSDHVFIN